MTVVFGTILATCLGVIAASVTILTLIALGPMVTRGYDKPLAAGSIVASGTLGILIPPSIMLVVYGPQAGISIGQMFMGAVFPGLMLAASYVVYIVVRCWRNPDLGPAIPADQLTPFSTQKLWRLLKSLVPPIFLILAVLGTIFPVLRRRQKPLPLVVWHQLFLPLLMANSVLACLNTPQLRPCA